MATSVSLKPNPPKWVEKINTSILSFLGANKQFEDLGPAYSSMSFRDAESNLQLYRMHKKFERPDDTNASTRKTNSLWTMVDYDADGIDYFEIPINARIDPYVRHQLYRIRNRLREIITDYRFDVSSLEFPSGETYVSASGDISLYAKLRDITQWCCTLDCFDLFARVCFNTPMLKFAARRHFKTYFASKKRERGEMATWPEKEMWISTCTLHKSHEKRAFEIFKAKLRLIVTFVRGARLTTVPKSILVDRVITCEPFCNMIVQRTIEIDVRRLIELNFDIDLDESQVIHKALIQDLENATIDLSNASNSVYTAVVKWFFGQSTLFKHLIQARSPEVEVENGVGWQLNMLAPMGNGYTFGIMTLLLLTICREYDDFAHVFGDDIIVHEDVANDVITLLRNIGFETNNSKTFLNGSFRESCGGFVSHGRYITSFELNWAEDEVDAVVLVNKIGVMAYATNSRLRRVLQRLHGELLSFMPPTLFRECFYVSDYAGGKLKLELKQLKDKLLMNAKWPELRLRTFRVNSLNTSTLGPMVPHSHCLVGDDWSINDRFSLGDGVYVRPSYYRERRDTRCAGHVNNYLSEVVEPLKKLTRGAALQLSAGDLNAYVLYSKKAKVYRSKDGTPLCPVKNISRLFGWFYIWAGKILAPHLRDTYVTNRWVVEGPKTLGYA